MDETETLKALEEGWRRLGVEIDAYVDPKKQQLDLFRVVVPKPERKKGLGTKAMGDLIAYADQFGLLFTLSPSTDFGGTSVVRLKRFYRRFGFVSNKGRNKIWQISASMYRLPVRAQG